MKEFEQKYTTEPNTGCWLWLGSLHSGYGNFKGEGAHRFSYKLHKGPIPKGKETRHSCHVRACVNPDHLSLGSKGDNMRDMFAAGREGNNIIAQRRMKTHCHRGHPFDEKNTLLRKDRFERECRECKRIRANK